MGDVINLNQYRKRRERDEKAKKARENRVRTGRSGSEKAAARRDGEKSAKELEHKRLGPATETDAKADGDSSREPPEGSTPSAG